MNELSSYVFTIDDGAQAPVILAAKTRSIIAATFTKFLLKNIGRCIIVCNISDLCHMHLQVEFYV